MLPWVEEAWRLVSLHQLTPAEHVAQVELPGSSSLTPFPLRGHLLDELVVGDRNTRVSMPAVSFITNNNKSCVTTVYNAIMTDPGHYNARDHEDSGSQTFSSRPKREIRRLPGQYPS